MVCAGKPMTQMIPVEKTEHYSVNAAEVSFYAWQIYNSYINSSTGSDSANLPDTEKPLADQNYDNDTTWEAYFTDAAQKYAENVLAYCEAADKENYEFPENISAMVKTAKEQMDFSTLPSSVTQDDVTHALELYFKAQSFSTSVEENMSFTDDELESYYKENAKTMDVCSYMEFSFPMMIPATVQRSAGAKRKNLPAVCGGAIRKMNSSHGCMTTMPRIRL